MSESLICIIYSSSLINYIILLREVTRRDRVIINIKLQDILFYALMGRTINLPPKFTSPANHMQRRA